MCVVCTTQTYSHFTSSPTRNFNVQFHSAYALLANQNTISSVINQHIPYSLWFLNTSGKMSVAYL